MAGCAATLRGDGTHLWLDGTERRGNSSCILRGGGRRGREKERERGGWMEGEIDVEVGPSKGFWI